jgi:uncharacterized protein (UPF0332 family)
VSDDLLVTARRLAKASPKKPRQADLKRAVSTAYYALFHAMAKNAADMVAGTGANKAEKAWAQVYRAMDHGFAKNACKEVAKLGFPSAIVTCADEFVTLQEARHRADYDPVHRLTRAEALTLVARAEAAIKLLKAATLKDRRAFAVQLLLKKRPP